MSVATLIDGAKHAMDLRARTRVRAQTFRASFGRRPRLDVIIVGDHPASRSYVTSKTKQAIETEIDGRLIELPETVGADELLGRIRQLNDNSEVDGILIQLPLPEHLDASAVLDEIDPAKDVDGFHPVNVGRLFTASVIEPEKMIVPCTPLGSWLMLRETIGQKALSGKSAVVVGRSNIVGKPMAQLLLASDCTVTLAHSRTGDLAALCRTADILVAAVGRPEMIRGSWIKPGAIVIDVGINRVPTPGGKTRIVGDVATQEAMSVASFVTPVPGGVGRMTVACLLFNTVVAAERRAELGRKKAA
jgi:methylenetetrahydrofolate dehydrogenase (NADP+) / methenyltetrahydrofolate cyclohydrolase